ncbi:MAG: hypothetical protein ABF968_11055 [Acetobacter sp.]
MKPNPACAARIQVGVERCLADRVQSMDGLMLVVPISDEMSRKRRIYGLSTQGFRSPSSMSAARAAVVSFRETGLD